MAPTPSSLRAFDVARPRGAIRFWLIAGAVFLAGAFSVKGREKIQPWPAIDSAELRDDKPAIDPGAAAEALLWKLEVDDRGYPFKRQYYAYIRFKIFDPERAVDVTRFSQLIGAYEGADMGQVELRARLTLPDGTIREFGDESIQERDAAHQANRNTWFDRLTGPRGLSVQEKFLAVSGIKPGAILEFQEAATTELSPAVFAYLLQSPNGVPVRHLEAKFYFAEDQEHYLACPFLLNSGRLRVTAAADLKNQTLQVAADALPALATEPFSAAVLDRAVALVGTYVPRYELNKDRVSAKAGLWEAIATKYYLIAQAATKEIPAVKDLAATLTAGAKTDSDRARRIHNYVHAQFLRYLDLPQSGRSRNWRYWTPLDQVIGIGANPTVMLNKADFFWLAGALYRAAGLRTEMMLLPNRTYISFSHHLISDIFLPERAMRVFADGSWQYSVPTTTLPEPFGSLPWFARGSVGLVAGLNVAEFVAIPAAPPSESVISNFGSLELDASGGLSGHCRRVWQGEPAVELKSQLRILDEEKRMEMVRDQLKDELKCDDVTLTKLQGVDDLDAPLSAEYDLHWQNFAVGTKRRLIFRPSVFHGLVPTPFTAEMRHNPIDFKYGWAEIDQFDLRLPPGYRLESALKPAAQTGEGLNYRLQITFDREKGQLHVRRDFSSNLHHTPVSAYGGLRQWYGEMARHDAAESVLIKPGVNPPANIRPTAPP
jgi:hypothetical protein